MDVPIARSNLTITESLLDSHWDSSVDVYTLTHDFSRALGILVTDGLARVGLREPLKVNSPVLIGYIWGRLN